MAWHRRWYMVPRLLMVWHLQLSLLLLLLLSQASPVSLGTLVLLRLGTAAKRPMQKGSCPLVTLWQALRQIATVGRWPSRLGGISAMKTGRWVSMGQTSPLVTLGS